MRIEDYDSIVLLSCEANRFRLDNVLDESIRVGFGKLPQFYISSRGPTGQDNTAYVFQHLLKNGCERVLVLEDDIRFLRDYKRAVRIIESAPCKECDGVFFDIFPQWGDSLLANVIKKRSEGVAFMGMIPFTYGASCYSVNRRYMERFLANHDACPKEPCDSMLFTCDPNLNNVFSLNPPCVQVLYENAANRKWGNIQHELYKKWGVDYADFNVEEGFTFGSVLQKPTEEE